MKFDCDRGKLKPKPPIEDDEVLRTSMLLIDGLPPGKTISFVGEASDAGCSNAAGCKHRHPVRGAAAAYGAEGLGRAGAAAEGCSEKPAMRRQPPSFEVKFISNFNVCG